MISLPPNEEAALFMKAPFQAHLTSRHLEKVVEHWKGKWGTCVCKVRGVK